jgi:hypothetical protein
MDSIFSAMIPSLVRSAINASCSACIYFTIQVYALSIIFLASPDFSHYGKFDCHQLCRKPGQSRLSCFFHLESLLGNYRSWSQASLSRDKSSHNDPFILRVFIMPKVYVVLPYCDEPIIIIVTTLTHSHTESLCGA